MIVAEIFNNSERNNLLNRNLFVGQHESINTEDYCKSVSHMNRLYIF